MADSSAVQLIVQLSSRGQITLPVSMRRQLGLRAGDLLVVSAEDGRIVLQPAVGEPLEIYSDAAVREFDRHAAMTEEELVAAKAIWRLRSS